MSDSPQVFPEGCWPFLRRRKRVSRCKIHGHGLRWMKMPFGTASIFVWSCYLAFYALLFWGGHDSISEKILIVCWGWMFGSLNTGICDIVPESLSSQKEQAMLKLRIFLFKKIIRLFPVHASIVCPTIYEDHGFGRYFFRITRHTIWVLWIHSQKLVEHHGLEEDFLGWQSRDQVCLGWFLGSQISSMFLSSVNHGEIHVSLGRV